MDSKTESQLRELLENIDSLQDAGQTIEAIHAATEYLEKCQALPDSDPGKTQIVADGLEKRADLLRFCDACEQACDDYINAIEKLANGKKNLIQLGRLHAGLGAAYAALGENGNAASQWERSIECFETNDPPSPLDVASMANNFGFLKKASGDYDAAENAFLKALEILHAELGETHEETATVAANLGELYYEAGHLGPAEKMHRMAAGARSAVLGDYHPDTAQSHTQIAQVFLGSGNRTSARQMMEKALNAYISLGREFHQELGGVAKTYCELLREDGELSMAEAITFRIRAILGDKVPV